MQAERPVLTKEQVMKAESRVGVTHPVLSVIDTHLPRILQLNQEFAPITNNQEQQRFIKERYGFMADALVEAGPYTLEPTDLLAIWSRAMEIFSDLHRYALAGVVSSAYAVRGLVGNEEWKRFPRYYFEYHEIPEPINRHRIGLIYVRHRLSQVQENIRDLDSYVNGVRGGVSLAVELAKKKRDGDEGAKKELDALIAHEEEYKSPTIAQIHENFGNGMTPLSFSVSEALKATIA